MTTSGTGDGSQFTEADYDFSDVKSKSDLSACNYYEYARESRAARAEVAAVREQILQRKGEPGRVIFGPRVQNLLQSQLLMMLSLASGFPTTPWRCLPDRDKQILMKHLAAIPHLLRYILTWNKPPLTFAAHEPGETTLNMWRNRYRGRLSDVSDTEPVKYGFFAVNLKYGHAVLAEEFTKWLRHLEGKPMLEFPPAATKPVSPKPPGRKSIRDSLNALSVMRLRYYCDSFSEAQEKMEPLKGKPTGMYYGRRDNCNRACGVARLHFKTLFGWLDSEDPLHFTSGWRGGTRK